MKIKYHIFTIFWTPQLTTRKKLIETKVGCKSLNLSWDRLSLSRSLALPWHRHGHNYKLANWQGLLVSEKQQYIHIHAQINKIISFRHSLTFFLHLSNDLEKWNYLKNNKYKFLIIFQILGIVTFTKMFSNFIPPFRFFILSLYLLIDVIWTRIELQLQQVIGGNSKNFFKTVRFLQIFQML